MKLSFSGGSEGAKAFFLGVPFDSTSSFRPGSRFAPEAIRQASCNFESYDCFLKKEPEGIVDFGDLSRSVNYEDLEMELTSLLRLHKEHFPIIAGGEHSITPIIVSEMKGRYDNLFVITLDAHMDFRRSYMGTENSHACASRKVSEIVGIENMLLMGLRSFSREEAEGSKNLEYYTSLEVRERLDELCDRIDDIKNNIYLSIDMDCFDPAYAPAVGNPEPYGLNPLEVRRIIESASPKLVGFDIVELCPPYDNGNTACLAAKLVHEIALRR